MVMKKNEVNNKLRQVFLDSCSENLKLQDPLGYMPSGHNGSYIDEETPVRNTAHWIVSFVKAYELTKDKSFYNAIIIGLDFLKDEILRPSRKTFICREKESKDKCNGLIGQAWVIEGLMAGYRVTQDKDVLDLASEVFLLHPFSEKKNMWYRVEPTGAVLTLDKTFNHQLWFAMSGFLIIKAQQNKEIENRCLRFFNVISENLKLSNNGRIGQSVKLDLIEDVIKYNLKRIVRKNELQYIKLKEIGYHAFNTYAFSIIYDLYPNLKFFKTNDYRKNSFKNSSEYKNNIYNSNYGFKYNPPGFEVLKTYNTHESILNNSVEFIDGLLNFHLENNYDNMKCSFTRNVHDKNTSAARIYELSSSF